MTRTPSVVLLVMVLLAGFSAPGLAQAIAAQPGAQIERPGESGAGAGSLRGRWRATPLAAIAGGCEGPEPFAVRSARPDLPDELDAAARPLVAQRVVQAHRAPAAPARGPPVL